MSNRHDIIRARSLRRSASPPEVRLWSFLRTLRREGHHFRRQAPFRGYVLDFVCCTDRGAIEVDSAAHDNEARMTHDASRDAVLAREGFRTLRFQATDVLRNLDGISIAIREALPPPTPALPTRGREKKSTDPR
jgi:very-short-patch-repair endonuclease